MGDRWSDLKPIHRNTFADCSLNPDLSLLIRHHEVLTSVRAQPVEAWAALRQAQCEGLLLHRTGSIGRKCPKSNRESPRRHEVPPNGKLGLRGQIEI